VRGGEYKRDPPRRRREGNSKENFSAGSVRGIHRRIFLLRTVRGIQKIKLRITNPKTLPLGITNPQQQQNI